MRIIDNVHSIRRDFQYLSRMEEFRGNGTIEIQNALFRADEPSIFGTPNKAYEEAEHAWYLSQCRSVMALEQFYGKPVKIWEDIASEEGLINSNYGWCVFNRENGSQYDEVLKTLRQFKRSRQAVMIYNRPSMHVESKYDGMNDFMCTQNVQYFINDGRLDATVNMRSSDAVFGYAYDRAWQIYIQDRLANDLNVDIGELYWNAGSLHIYERHYDLMFPKNNEEN